MKAPQPLRRRRKAQIARPEALERVDQKSSDGFRLVRHGAHARLQVIAEAIGTDSFEQVLDQEFAAIEGTSIDYAVMERHDNVLVVESPFQWDDVGNWQSLERIHGVDQQGNTIVGQHLGIDTRRSIIRGNPDHLVVTFGMDNCIIVHTNDATLVANRDDEEAIRRIVQQLEEKGLDKYL